MFVCIQRRLVITKKQIQPFCFIDTDKNYTRNLIATDDETFTLLLLCWNPGKYSPIHDHPCNGCWMRVCQGCVNEVQYRDDYSVNEGDCEKGTASTAELQSTHSFVRTTDTVFHEGQQTFIHDNIGYHKVSLCAKSTLSTEME